MRKFEFLALCEDPESSEVGLDIDDRDGHDSMRLVGDRHRAKHAESKID